jgi:hypothetical protein
MIPGVNYLHHVALPHGATPAVTPGERVLPDQPLALTRTTGAAFRVPLARMLGRRPEAVAELLLAGPGARLEAGAAIARAPDGREAVAPRAATFVAYRPGDGSALLVEQGPEVPVVGHVRGSVMRVTPRSVEVSVAGVRLGGVGGIGEAVHGELVMAVHRHDEELRAGSVDVSVAGRILVGGSRASAETLTRARAMGAAGMVLGGIFDKELRDFEAIQRRRREVGGLAGRFAVILLEGYGKVALDPQLFAWFRAHSGRTASLLGEQRTLIVYDASEPPRRTSHAGVGDRVVAHGRPYAGRAGVLVGVLDDLHATPSGVAAVTALVRFEDGRLAPVPLANLESTVPAPA